MIPNVLEKYMNFNINNKLVFFDNFQFLSSLLDSLVKRLGRNGFIWVKNSVITYYILSSKNTFILMNIWVILKHLKNNERTKKFFIVPWPEKANDKEHEHVSRVWNKSVMKDYHDLYLKCDVLLLAEVLEKSRNSCLKNFWNWTYFKSWQVFVFRKRYETPSFLHF